MQGTWRGAGQRFYGLIRRLLSLSAGACILVMTGSLRAEPERVRLQFRADEQCPSEESFRREVLTRSGDVQFDSERPTRVLEISAGAADAQAWGEVRFYRPGENGTSRRIQDKTCQGVVSALALIAVLAIDPRASLAPSPPSPSTPAEQLTNAAPEAPPSPSVRAAQLPPSWRAIAGAEALTGRSPSLAIGLAAAIQFGVEQGIRPALRLGGRLGTSPRVERGPGTAQFRSATAFFEVSPARLLLGAVELSGWAGIDVGQVTAEGVSTPSLGQVGQASALWVALYQAARFGLDWGSGWHGELELGLVEPLRHDQFYFDQPQTLVYEIPPLGVMVGIGAGYHFF